MLTRSPKVKTNVSHQINPKNNKTTINQITVWVTPTKHPQLKMMQKDFKWDCRKNYGKFRKTWISSFLLLQKFIPKFTSNPSPQLPTSSDLLQSLSCTSPLNSSYNPHVPSHWTSESHPVSNEPSDHAPAHDTECHVPDVSTQTCRSRSGNPPPWWQIDRHTTKCSPNPRSSRNIVGSSVEWFVKDNNPTGGKQRKCGAVQVAEGVRLNYRPLSRQDVRSIWRFVREDVPENITKYSYTWRLQIFVWRIFRDFRKFCLNLRN